MKIVLASESPFRWRALDMLGLEYEVSPARIDEKAIRDENPLELTRKIAEAKARRIKIAVNYPDAIIVAGDAVAAKGNKIFEKPRDNREAAEFLRELSGSQFQFITSLVVLHSRTEKILSAVEVLNITFRRLLDREIQDYIGRYPVLNYAGAFENDAVYRFSERIEGSYNIGTAIPVGRLTLFLREFGVEV